MILFPNRVLLLSLIELFSVWGEEGLKNNNSIVYLLIFRLFTGNQLLRIPLPKSVYI